MICYHLIIYGLLLKLVPSTGDDLFELRSQKIQLEGRIIGGQEVQDIKSYPFMAQFLSIVLDKRQRKFQKQLCGSTILSPTHVLTAAHCLTDCVCAVNICHCEDRNKELMCVFAGTRESMFRVNTTCPFKIMEFHIHPSYKATDFLNKCKNRYDAGVVKLRRTLPFSDTIAKVNLATAADIKQDLTYTETSKCIARGEKSTILGWGLSDVKETTPAKFLKVAQVPLLDYKTCLIHFNISNSTFPNKGVCTDNTQICSKDLQMMEAACTGDSGGPIICEGKQIGIISWRLKGPCVNRPQIYTRVDVIVNWINQMLI